MTRKEWLGLEVGDVIVDTMSSNLRREILGIERIDKQGRVVTGDMMESGRKAGRILGVTRISITAKSERGQCIVLFDIDDHCGGKRFTKEAR